MKDLEKFYTAFTGGELFPNKYGVIVENMSEEDEKAIGDFFTRNVGTVVFVKKEDDLVYIKFKDPDDRTKVLKDIIGKTSYKSLREKYGIKKWDINSFSDNIYCHTFLTEGFSNSCRKMQTGRLTE